MTTRTRHPRADAYWLEGRSYNAPCRHYAPCGCEQARCCLACPLALCKFDAGGMKRVRAQRLGETVRGLRRLGFTAQKIHRTLTVSRRTVYRHLAGG